MRRVRLLLLCAGTALATAACSSQDEATVSAPSYISWSQSTLRQTTLMQVRSEAINVCIRGRASTADLDRAKLWTRQSALTWLRAMKVLDERVTGNVVLTCTDAHLTINLLTGSGRSYASPRVANLYLGVAYGTWTHELGHAFVGLGDTYTGSTAGACMSGQPESLMCWGAYGPRKDPMAYSTLWPDDIAGVQRNFRTMFPGESAGLGGPDRSRGAARPRRAVA